MKALFVLLEMMHHGNQHDPIYVKSEEEEQKEMRKRLEFKRNKLLLQEAIMTGSSF